MMIKKKASIELSFNWIYIALIGGLIIIGTVIFLNNMRKQTTEELGSDVKENLNVILETIKDNPQGEQTIELAGSSLSFDCYGYGIEGSDSARIAFEEKAIFSPDLIKQQMIGSGNLLSLPFNKISIGYITSPNIKYIFYDSSASKQLFNEFPKNANAQLISNYKAFDNQNYYKVRYISFGSPPSISELGNIDIINNKDIAFVKIMLLQDTTTFPESLGKVTYYQKSGNSFELIGESYFIDKSTLIGAIFSENKEIYECNLAKALKNLKLSLDIDKERLTELSAKKNSLPCNYVKIIDDINAIEEVIKTGAITENNLIRLSQLKKTLKEDNDYLKRLSCQLIY
jgi:hypothetical protein